MASLDTRRPGRAGAAAPARRADAGGHAADRRRPDAGRHRQTRRAGGKARRPRRGHPRHRRPHPYRRAADGRDGRDQAGVEAARDPAGRRCADRPGRRQPRPLLRRARRHHRPGADAHGWRRARRRGAFHARRHRQADQADRHRREDGCAGGVPSAPHRRPHSGHGRHRLASSRRRPRPSTRKRPRRWRRRCSRASST